MKSVWTLRPPARVIFIVVHVRPSAYCAQCQAASQEIAWVHFIMFTDELRVMICTILHSSRVIRRLGVYLMSR